MKHEEFLQELLERTKRRLKLMELGAGAVIFLAVMVVSLTLGVILDHAFALPKVARWAILLALDGAVAIAVLVAAVFLLRRLNDVFIARLIEKLSPGFRNTLVATIEARRLPDIPAGIKDFIEEQAAEKAASVDPLLAVSPRRLVVASYALLLAFLFFFFYSFFTHKSVLVALERIWAPGADIPPATATQIVSVEPGSRAVLATGNGSLPVVVRLRGVIPRRVTLQWSREQELWGSLELTSAKDGRQWETALADLEHDLFYSIQAGDARSPTYHLHVVPVPLVTSLQTDYRFPDYTGLPERVTYRGDVDALEGTLITVQAHTNTTLAQAGLLVNDVTVPASIHQPQPGEEPGDTIEGSFTVSRGGFYSIRLTDPYGFTNPDPVRYEILCRYDQPPAVHILEPREGVRLPVSQPLTLTFEAKDDLGLASLQFHYKLPQEEAERSESLPLPANVREVHNQVTVYLDRLGLEPGQTLACYLQAADTFPGQPHVGRSDTLVVAVPLPEELTRAYAQAPGPGEGQAEAKGTQEGAAAQASPTSTTAETPAGQGQEAENQEPSLEKMLARDQTTIDTIRQFLAEDAQAQAAGQPGEQPGAPTGQGAATSQGAPTSQGAATAQGAPAATQANTGATGTGGAQPAGAGQPNPQAPAGAAASTPPAPSTPPVTVWPTGEVGEPGQEPLRWPSEVSAASGSGGAAQPAANAQVAAGAGPNPPSAAIPNPTGQPGAPASGSGQSGTPTSQAGGAQPGQGAQSGQPQAQAGGQQAPSGAAASAGAQAGQQASSQGSASGQTQGGQGNAQGQSSAGQAGAQPGGQSSSQAGQSAGQGGAQAGGQSSSQAGQSAGQGGAQPGGQSSSQAGQSAGQGGGQAGGQSSSQAGQSAGQGGAQSGGQSSSQAGQSAGQGGAQSGGQAQAGAAAQPGSSSSSPGGGSPNPAAGAQQGAVQGEPLNPSQTLHPAGGSGGPGGGGGGGTSGTQAPDLAVRGGASTPEGEREKLAVVGQVIDQLYDRLLRNDVDPKLLEKLNWKLEDLAAWVVTYKAKLDQLPKEQGDAGILLGGAAPGLPGAEKRVIEMGKSPLADRPAVGEATPPLSPDEVARLLQGAKGTVSPEYRTLLEDYYKALADSARR